MILKLAIKEPFKDLYFWGCSSYPGCRSIEKTILKLEKSFNWREEESKINSMKYLNPTDIVSDAIRHSAICDHFKYDHKFTLSDIDKLDLTLCFNTKQDFFFWVATQKSIVTHSVHNYLPVGSPYYFTFKELRKSINKNYQKVIKNISTIQIDDIENSINKWREYFQAIEESETARIKFSEEKVDIEHQLALKRKSEKATINIFNAIRRKDVKAIIELRKKGADLYSKNENGLNCIEYADSLGVEKVIESLRKDISKDTTNKD